MCDKKTARCGKPNPCCHNNLYEIMGYLHDLCAKNDIKYMLDSGSILGAVREGDIIKHDTDIDISMTDQNYKKLQNIFPHISKSYPIIHDRNKDLVRVMFSDKNLLHVDIWIWHDHNALLHKMNYEGKTYIMDKKYLNNLENIKLRGKDFYGTVYKEEFCALKFGKDWKTPIVGKPGTLRYI